MGRITVCLASLLLTLVSPLHSQHRFVAAPCQPPQIMERVIVASGSFYFYPHEAAFKAKGSKTYILVENPSHVIVKELKNFLIRDSGFAATVGVEPDTNGDMPDGIAFHGKLDIALDYPETATPEIEIEPQKDDNFKPTHIALVTMDNCLTDSLRAFDGKHVRLTFRANGT